VTVDSQISIQTVSVSNAGDHDVKINVTAGVGSTVGQIAFKLTVINCFPQFYLNHSLSTVTIKRLDAPFVSAILQTQPPTECGTFITSILTTPLPNQIQVTISNN
jgi:hypothetical protein